MKRTITAILVLVISAFATATAGGKGETTSSSSKKISLNTIAGFTKLVVNGNVDVVLFEDDAASDVSTFGNGHNMASTVITQKNGVLYITNNSTSGEKVLVYVPVKALSVIEANGNAKVSSASALQLEKLTLVAKGDCQFAIRSTGKIVVEKEGEVELQVEETSLPFVTTAHS